MKFYKVATYSKTEINVNSKGNEHIKVKLRWVCVTIVVVEKK